MPKLSKPKLVNRGAAGLLVKIPEGSVPVNGKNQAVKTDYSLLLPPGVSHVRNKIAPALCEFIVDISTLTLDPNNARLHPERNLQAIRASLCLYGQTVPLVVRKQTRVVVAGNGRLEAALSLGWTKIAASFIDMTEAEAAGYGLADNRTAELASWDFEVVARLEKLTASAGIQAVGWTMDELEVLRAADWTPPTVSGNGDEWEGENKPNPLVIEFTAEQLEEVNRVGEIIRAGQNRPKMSTAECLCFLCSQFMEGEV